MIRPVDTRNPQATIRNAISSIPLAVSLGGRPARYTWWPHHLADNSFRQPLAGSDLESSTLVLDWEAWLVFWPDFYGGPSRSQGEVTLVLTDGPVLQTRVQHLVPMQPVWGLSPTPALADWYRRQGATFDDDLIVRVLDVETRRYAISLARRAERDEAAIAARNRALADAAEMALRAGRPPMPAADLIPRLVRALVDQVTVYADGWVKIEGLLDGSEAAQFGSVTSPTSDLWYNFSLAAPVLQDRVARGDSLHTGEVSVQPH
jgi:hypothetical protein